MSGLALDVALTPSLLPPGTARGSVAILIDALRATSTLSTLFALGARSVELPRTLRHAQRLASQGRPVAAESVAGGQAPRCTIPVAPSRLHAAAVAGQDLVFCTTNGTRAARIAARRAEHVLFGSLLNASAVAERAVSLAGDGGRVVAVCAGREWNRIPCLDDTYVAGVLVERVRAAAERAGRAVRQTDAARIAALVAGAYPTPLAAFERSATSAVLHRAGSADDIAFCARLDAVSVVPELARPGAPIPPHPVYLSDDLVKEEAAA